METNDMIQFPKLNECIPNTRYIIGVDVSIGYMTFVVLMEENEKFIPVQSSVISDNKIQDNIDLHCNALSKHFNNCKVIREA